MIIKKILNIQSRLIKNGIAIKIKGRTFNIEYPSEIWRSFPLAAREFLLDNLVFADTSFLAETFKSDCLKYNTPVPLFEPYIFRNNICDMLDTERVDNVPFLCYLRHYYNTEYEFANRNCRLPFWPVKDKKLISDVILPFTFGKESLLSFMLCRELKIKSTLVYVQDPVEQYEDEYKKPRLKYFSQLFNVPAYYLKNEAGLFKAGKAFNIKIDTGWGVQVTVLALSCLPFAFATGAKYILFGSEYANNEYDWREGWKVHHSYDQSAFWTKEKNSMIRVSTAGATGVGTTLEPLEEPSIFYILHHRYPEAGKHQFSCRAEKPLYGGSQWCHNCYKCARMYLFARAFNVNPSSIGFKKDLLRPDMFEDFLSHGLESGSYTDLNFAFFILHKKKEKCAAVELFAKNIVNKIKPWKYFVEYFTTLHPTENMPSEYENALKKIFRAELRDLRRYLESLR